MSKYNCISFGAYAAIMQYSNELDPKDFLDCEDLDELIDEATIACYNGKCSEYSSIDQDFLTPDPIIPEQFIEEWKTLKENI